MRRLITALLTAATLFTTPAFASDTTAFNVAITLHYDVHCQSISANIRDAAIEVFLIPKPEYANAIREVETAYSKAGHDQWCTLAASILNQLFVR